MFPFRFVRKWGDGVLGIVGFGGNVWRGGTATCGFATGTGGIGWPGWTGTGSDGWPAGSGTGSDGLPGGLGTGSNGWCGGTGTGGSGWPGGSGTGDNGSLTGIGTFGNPWPGEDRDWWIDTRKCWWERLRWTQGSWVEQRGSFVLKHSIFRFSLTFCSSLLPTGSFDVCVKSGNWCQVGW